MRCLRLFPQTWMNAHTTKYSHIRSLVNSVPRELFMKHTSHTRSTLVLCWLAPCKLMDVIVVNTQLRSGSVCLRNRKTRLLDVTY